MYTYYILPIHSYSSPISFNWERETRKNNNNNERIVHKMFQEFNKAYVQWVYGVRVCVLATYPAEHTHSIHTLKSIAIYSHNAPSGSTADTRTNLWKMSLSVYNSLCALPFSERCVTNDITSTSSSVCIWMSEMSAARCALHSYTRLPNSLYPTKYDVLCRWAKNERKEEKKNERIIRWNRIYGRRGSKCSLT